MELNKYRSALESVLFASGDPVPLERLSGVIGLDKNTVKKILADLAESYKARESGIEIIQLDDSYQMCTKSENYDYIKKAMDIRRNTPLSQAALEVLAIIAYNQPVTRSFVEKVRGVDCSYIISSLVEKSLIEEKGRMELPGRPLIYGTTTGFLRCFGIHSLKDLPPIPKKEQTVSNESGV